MSPICFCFVGGPLDGQTQDDQRIEMYMTLTHQGEIGRRFWTASDFYIDQAQKGIQVEGASGHKYEVIERVVRDGNLIIRAKYLGTT